MGTPLSVHNVHNRSWKPLLERAGLPASTRMHDLRHTCATLLLSKHVPLLSTRPLALSQPGITEGDMYDRDDKALLP
jgi:integrase